MHKRGQRARASVGEAERRHCPVSANDCPTDYDWVSRGDGPTDYCPVGPGSWASKRSSRSTRKEAQVDWAGQPAARSADRAITRGLGLGTDATMAGCRRGVRAHEFSGVMEKLSRSKSRG